MTDTQKLDIGSAIGAILSYIFKNLPAIGKATLIPSAVFMILTFYWFFPQFFPFLGAVIENADTGNDQAVIASLARFFASILVLLILSLVIYGMTLVPLLRHAMFEEPVGFFRMDSLVLRAIVGLIFIFAMTYGVIIVLMIPVGIVQAILFTSENEAGALVLEGVATLVMYVVMAYVMTRASLILPDIVASGRLRIAAGWRATRGNFWRIFLTYLVIYIIMTVIMYIGLIIAMLAVGFMVATNSAILNMEWDNLNVEMLAATYSAIMYSPAGFVMVAILTLTTMFSIGVYAGMFGTTYKMIVNPDP